MDVRDLLDMRSRIDQALPALALRDMNLEQELVIQYLTAKELQTMVLSSGEEANKKAQTLNAVGAALQALIKMQSEYHTAERLKEIETRLVRCLEKLPKEQAQEFLAWYATV
jgi:hypothetical protein